MSNANLDPESVVDDPSDSTTAQPPTGGPEEWGAWMAEQAKQKDAPPWVAWLAEQAALQRQGLGKGKRKPPPLKEMGLVRITVDVPAEQHRRLRRAAVDSGTSIRGYVLDLLTREGIANE